MTFKKNKSNVEINPLIIKNKKEIGNLIFIEIDDGFEKDILIIEKENLL